MSANQIRFLAYVCEVALDSLNLHARYRAQSGEQVLVDGEELNFPAQRLMLSTKIKKVNFDAVNNYSTQHFGNASFFLVQNY